MRREEKLVAAAREFVERVRNYEVRSFTLYSKFVYALAEYDGETPIVNSDEESDGKRRLYIYAPKGTKVTFAYPDSGWPYEEERNKKLLDPQQVYTVKHISVGSTSTEVELEELPGKTFNSVIFRAIE